MGTKLFTRASDEFAYKIYKNGIIKILNINKLALWTKYNTNKLHSINNEKHFLRYRFELVLRWINSNEVYSKTYVENLNKIIEALDIKNYLNNNELNYLHHYEGVVFAKIRNLKSLIIDFQKGDNETIFYHYEHTNIYQINSLQEKLILDNIDFYISTERLIFSENFEIFSILFKDIIDYKLSHFGLTIKTNNQKYLIRCEDPYIHYVSLERVLKFKGYEI